MFEVLAQHGIELTIGGTTVGAILGFVGKHLLSKRNGGYQTKEICKILHTQTKDTLDEIKTIVTEIRNKD